MTSKNENLPSEAALTANIIVMGKGGAGKSTLINTILGEKRAKTGIGQAVTLKNKTYGTTVRICSEKVTLELMDTVGFELDSTINTKIIQSVQRRIDELIRYSGNINEIQMVWYCVNPNGNRFEDFEVNFIRKMMYEYETPFMIVLTQCFDVQQEKAMREAILKDFPDIPIESVLAEKTSRVDAYGVQELLEKTVTQFNDYKMNVLKKKLEQVNTSWKEHQDRRAKMLERGTLKASKIVKEKAEAAFVLGCIPGVSTVALQSQFTAVCTEVAAAFGITMNEDTVSAIAAIWVVGLVMLPIAIIPVLAGAMAKDLIKDLGQQFIDTIVSVIMDSSNSELYDNDLMSKRLINEIKSRNSK